MKQFCKHKTALYHLTAFAVVAVWGSTFVLTKLLLLWGLTPASIFTIRFVMAYMVLLLLSPFGKRIRWFADNVKDELLMLGLGVTGGSLYFLTENTAMNYTSTTNTSLIVSMCPLCAALVISLFYKSERLKGVQVLGTLIAAAGAAIVVLNGQFVQHLSPLGDALAFGACLSWAFYSLLMIPASQRYDTLFITRKVFFYGLVSMIPYYIVFRHDFPPVSIVVQPKVLITLLFLGCVASALCFFAWNWAIKKLGAIVTTNYGYLNPVVTIVCAWLVLSKRITGWFLVGTVLILSGMYLSGRRK